MNAAVGVEVRVVEREFASFITDPRHHDAILRLAGWLKSDISALSQAFSIPHRGQQLSFRPSDGIVMIFVLDVHWEEIRILRLATFEQGAPRVEDLEIAVDRLLNWV